MNLVQVSRLQQAVRAEHRSRSAGQGRRGPRVEGGCAESPVFKDRVAGVLEPCVVVARVDVLNRGEQGLRIVLVLSSDGAADPSPIVVDL